MTVRKVVRNSTRSFFGDGVGSIIPMGFDKQKGLSEDDISWLDWWNAEREKLWEKIRSFDVRACTEAFRLGDRLGAAWETGNTGWSPVPYDQILKRDKEHPKGTDESDIVDCFERFSENYVYDGDREKLLVAWADFHEKHRRHTSYGSTWRDYFQTVKYLRKKRILNLDSLYRCALERKPGGSAGNGFLALVMPVYGYALTIDVDPHDLVRDIVRFTHSHPSALSCARFLTHLFDIVRGVVDEFSTVECCPAIDIYYGRNPKAGVDDTCLWNLAPEEFVKTFPDNILCCNTVVHALYAVHSSKSEQDLVCRVVGLRGDVDSVLALALMLYRLFYSSSRREIAFARGQLTNLESSELYDFDWWRGWYF